MTKCAGVILAGGLSSRMGQDKASLKLDGKTLVRVAEELLRSAGLNQIYISSKPHIPDIIPACGPLGGVYSVLCHDGAKHDHLLFVPVDMPGLTPAYLKQLVAAPKDTDLVHFRSKKMPFRLSTNDKWRQLAHSLLQEGKQFSLGHFQDQISDKLILDIALEDEQFFVNINNSQEWQNFQNMGKI